ncbi:MAG: prepilin-type N-terminal cleavage/methylation domain-containing protein [Patescibacteria group bacterium]|nr:prepilin-type N-terminal cleavage/methylation domain-containing protein [Patescibacteria group bacterium]
MNQNFIYSNLKKRTNAFTLVELLIVIGIISVLAVTLLALLNPAEAQKRNRDSKRLKDANTLQAVISQYLEDGNTFGGTPVVCSTTTPCTSADAPPGANTVVCTNTAANWIGGVNASASFCPYAQAIPVDPINATTSIVDDSETGDTKSDAAVYRIAVSGRNYEINVRQESITNLSKVTGDSGDSDEWVEISNTQGMTLP